MSMHQHGPQGPQLQPGLSLEDLQRQRMMNAAARSQTILNIANGIYKDWVISQVEAIRKGVDTPKDNSFGNLANKSLDAAESLIEAFESRYGNPK